jgi:hypothetical protein
MKPRRPVKIPDPIATESRTDFAVRIFDSAEPPVTYYRAAKLAGISPVTLYKRLRRRELFEETRCPHCHHAPGERVRGGSGRTLPPSPGSRPQPQAET